MTINSSLTGTGWVVSLEGATLVWVAVPPTASSPGTRGNIAADSSFFYVCIATNTWLRVGIQTW